jgi:hypothetical protein
MKTYWANGCIAPRILNLGARWGWSVSSSCRFNPGERVVGTHWMGERLGPRAGTDAVMKRKITSPCQESNSELHEIHLSAYLFSTFLFPFGFSTQNCGYTEEQEQGNKIMKEQKESRFFNMSSFPFCIYHYPGLFIHCRHKFGVARLITQHRIRDYLILY